MQAEFPRRSNLPAEASQSKTARSKFAPALSHEAWLQLSQFALRLAILSLEAFSETGTDAPIRESISNCLKMTGIISGSKTQLKGDGDQDTELLSAAIARVDMIREAFSRVLELTDEHGVSGLSPRGGGALATSTYDRVRLLELQVSSHLRSIFDILDGLSQPIFEDLGAIKKSGIVKWIGCTIKDLNELHGLRAHQLLERVRGIGIDFSELKSPSGRQQHLVEVAGVSIAECMRSQFPLVLAAETLLMYAAVRADSQSRNAPGKATPMRLKAELTPGIDQVRLISRGEGAPSLNAITGLKRTSIGVEIERGRLELSDRSRFKITQQLVERQQGILDRQFELLQELACPAAERAHDSVGNSLCELTETLLSLLKARVTGFQQSFEREINNRLASCARERRAKERGLLAEVYTKLSTASLKRRGVDGRNVLEEFIYQLDKVQKIPDRPDDPEIVTRGYYPRSEREPGKFHDLLKLDGAELYVCRDTEKNFRGGVVAHLDQAPEVMHKLMRLYFKGPEGSDLTLRPGFKAGAMRFVFSDGTPGVYDRLMDTLLVRAAGRVDVLVCQVLLAPKANVRSVAALLKPGRTWLPIGAFRVVDQDNEGRSIEPQVWWDLILVVDPHLRRIVESTVGARGKRVDHKRLAQWACDIAKRVLKGEEPALPKLESLLLGHDLRKSAGGELAMIGDLEWTATGQRPKATEPQMFDAWQFITVPVEKG